MISLSHLYSTRFIINRELIEWVVILILLIVSLFNTLGLLIFLLALFILLLLQKEIGAIKIINLVTLRTIINPGVGVEISQLQILKWIILFSCAIFLLLSYLKMNKTQKNNINNIILLILLFGLFNIVSSFIFSTLPIVATSKLLSYTIIFLGILLGVTYTHQNFDWVKWMLKLLGIVIIPSILFISLPVGYLINGHAFQGLTNQPNMFGIVAALFVALLFTYKQINKTTIFNKVVLLSFTFGTLYMVILSKSRTGFIAFVLLYLMFILFSKISVYVKYILLNFTIFFFILIPSLRNNIISYIGDFLYKGQDNILYSRVNQVDGLLYYFQSNPWFGVGFQVPVLPYKSYEFSFNYIIEPGNLILSVLSSSGMIGFLLFLLYMGAIFFKNFRNFSKVGFLFVVVIIINMGEMVFFSSNNIGIWCYMYLAISTCYNKTPILCLRKSSL